MGLNLGRVLTGIGTGGLSEVVRGVNKLNESPQDKKARDIATNATAGWEDVRKQIPGTTVDANGVPTFNTPQLTYSNDPNDPNADIHGYQTGPALTHENVSMPTDPGTAWKDATSAYSSLGPSAWDNATSAYGDFAPDQAGRNAELGAGGYFAGIAKGGPDAQAEADYARRAKQAELSRRSNSEAALGQLEQRGMGGSGDALLAQLVNSQGAASDRYTAGLETNALAQARRDNAAQQYGSIGKDIYGNDINVADKRASGLDTFGTAKNAGQDLNTQKTAQGLDTFGTSKNNATDDYTSGLRKDTIGVGEWNATTNNDAADSNWTRGNSTNDANTALGNTVGQYNAVDAPQQAFNNQVTVQGGKTGAAGNAADIYASTAQHPFQDWILPTAGAVTKAAAPTPK